MAVSLQQIFDQTLGSLGRVLLAALDSYLLPFGLLLVLIVGALAFARRADDSSRKLQQSQQPRPSWPPTAPPPATMYVASVPSAPAGSMPILVADDSAVARAKLRKLLEGAGFEVDLASNGEEALSLVGRRPYAVLITDLEMPVVSGFEVIASVQGSLETEDLPIIAITGHDELSARVHACQGLYGIFQKPWNDRELLKRVATVAQLRRPAPAN